MTADVPRCFTMALTKSSLLFKYSNICKKSHRKPQIQMNNVDNNFFLIFFLHGSNWHAYQRCLPTYKNSHNFTEETERKRLDVKSRYMYE